MHSRIRLSIDASFDSVSLAGSCVGAVAATVLDPEQAARSELCVVEALTNLVEHGYRGLPEPNRAVDIDIYYDNDGFYVDIRDRGQSFIIEERHGQLRYDANDIENLPEGGMGLYLITQIADDVRYRFKSGENTLSLTMANTQMRAVP